MKSIVLRLWSGPSISNGRILWQVIVFFLSNDGHNAHRVENASKSPTHAICSIQFNFRTDFSNRHIWLFCMTAVAFFVCLCFRTLTPVDKSHFRLVTCANYVDPKTVKQQRKINANSSTGRRACSIFRFFANARGSAIHPDLQFDWMKCTRIDSGIDATRTKVTFFFFRS